MKSKMNDKGWYCYIAQLDHSTSTVRTDWRHITRASREAECLEAFCQMVFKGPEIGSASDRKHNLG